MSAFLNVSDGRVKEEFPLLSECLAGGALADLYSRLSLWDRPQLLAMQHEVKVLYQGVRSGMEAAALETKALLSATDHARVDKVLNDGISELSSLCSFVEGCLDLHLKRLEGKA